MLAYIYPVLHQFHPQSRVVRVHSTSSSLRPSSWRYHDLGRNLRNRMLNFNRPWSSLIACLTQNQESLIDILPKDVIDHIASGEVIHSLQSAICELVENSIDANCQKIVIQLDPDQDRLIVTDDGHGMSSKDMRLSLKCNATSKIKTRQDLENRLVTLGFRGQGLWAISQKCDSMEIRSRLPNASHGASLSWRNSKLHSPSDANGQSSENPFVAMAVGTVVIVNGLISHMKKKRHIFNLQQEISASRKWLEKTSMAFPNHSFLFKKDTRVTLQLNNDESIHQRLAKILGSHSPSDFIVQNFKLENEYNQMLGSFSIMLGLPDKVQLSNSNWVCVLVNGRLVSLPGISKAIAKLKKSFQTGKWPVFVCSCRLEGFLIDWNLSPRKNVMSLSCERELLSRLEHAIDTMIKFSPHAESYNVMAGQQTLKELIPDHDTDSVESHSHASEAIKFSILSQLFDTYILVILGKSLYIIEQHVAHERVLYEKLLKAWESSVVKLDVPISISRDLEESTIQNLAALGIQITGRQVLTLPVAAVDFDGPALESTLFRLGSGVNSQDYFAMVACKQAVKNGVCLESEFMESLIKNWLDTDFPLTCPHGRPIRIEIEEEQLSALFQRNWTLKSRLGKKPLPVAMRGFLDGRR